MLKKTLIVSMTAFLTILAISCKNDGESVCEKVNDLCHTSINCDQAGKDYDDRYDKASDAEKEAADKYADCVDDADSCDAVTKCGASQVSVTTSSSGGSSSGSITSDAGK
jgi:hypothetical protein